MEDGEREKLPGEEEPESEIKVNDRRLFNMDGEIREEAQERQKQEEEDEQTSRDDSATTLDQAPSGQDAGPGFEHRPIREPAEVDFTMLVNAMAQPALLFLGEIVPPGSGESRVDLEQARLQIDMLELLRVKCRGNLSVEEEGLLDRILYQLRMLYVARSRSPES